MKLRNKLLAGFFAVILVLSMMAGTALAATELPAKFDEAAGGGPVDGQTSQNDVWIKVIGGGTVYGNQEIAHATRSVDITITGKCSFDLEFIYNYDGGWGPPITSSETLDGEKVYNFPMNGAGTTWCEAVVNLRNKTEGPLEVTRMDFKDESGNVLLTVGPEAGSSGSSDATPKTGVVSTAVFFGIGAAVLGTGAVILKKKED